MNTQKFSIASDVISTYPDVVVAVVRVKILNLDKLAPIIHELSKQAENIHAELAIVEPITGLPEIAHWRSAYGLMDVKPSKFHSSIEALLRRVKKGGDLSTGLPIVDFYNLVSVVQRTPIGAYDADKLSDAGIRLRKAVPEKDVFHPLGGSADSFPLNPNLVVYGSSNEVLCWGFNTRDSRAVCVDENTTEVLFFSESTSAELKAPEVTIETISNLLADDAFEVGPVQVFNADQSRGTI